MTKAELRALVLGRLNRDDCTPTDADRFIAEATDRIQREVLHFPNTERSAFVDVTTTPLSELAVPADWLETIDLLVGGRPLDQQPYRVLVTIPAGELAVAYARFNGNFHIRGSARQGERVELLYYGKFTPTPDDGDTNELLSYAPYLAMYGALSAAGDHYQHEKTADWEGRYAHLRDTLRAEIVEATWAGGPLAVAPAYRDPGIGA